MCWESHRETEIAWICCFTFRDPCGVTAETLTTAWPPSRPRPRPISHHRGEKQLMQPYSGLVFDLLLFFLFCYRLLSLVMFFQADRQEENRKYKGKVRLKHTDIRPTSQPDFFRDAADQVLVERKRRKSLRINPLFGPFCKESHRGKQIPL